MKFFERISTQDKINFARHLSLMVKAGLPISSTLPIIQAQTESKVLVGVINSLRADIEGGKFLADALEKYEYLFGSFFVNIVRVGESSGTLAQNLLYLADELKKSKALRSKVRSAMVYPAVILVATIGIAGLLAFYVFPKLIPVFAGLNVQLPATTQALISFLGFAKDYGIYTLIAIAVFILVFRILVQRVAGIRYLVGRLTIATPVIGPLSVSVNMVNFARVLGLLLKSGVKIVAAMDITAHTFDNLVYERALLEAREGIEKGGQIADYLSRHKKIFPGLVTGMVQIGENTGNLEGNLAYIAEYYDEEVNNRLQTLTSLLEPLLMLLMGGLVGFIALSIITPIYSLSSGVR